MRRGLYQVVPVEHIGGEPPFDKFLLGRKLVSPYHFSHHSALEIHGVANATIFNTVYISSPKQFRRFSYGGIEYVWIRKRDPFGIQRSLWQDKEVYVSDREKTIIDCIDRVDLAGGFEEAFKSMISFPSVNLERLYAYLQRIGKKGLFHKIGFLLSLEDARKRWDVDQAFIFGLRKEVGEKVYYFATGKGRGKLVKEWNLIVPENLEAMMVHG